MLKSVKIERFKDCEELVRVLSRSEACPATNKDRIVPLNYEMLSGTNVPDRFVHRLGALITMVLKEQSVAYVEVWQTDTGGYWIADALTETARGHRLRRGEGRTPVEAINNLIVDIQRY